MKKFSFAVLFSVGATLASASHVFAASHVLGVSHVLAAAENMPDVPGSPLYPMPQGLISGVVTIVIFAILVAVLGKYAWAPILTGLRAREEKIRKEIADAEAARARADATLSEYNARLATAEEQVRAILNKATGDAQLVADQIRTRAEQEAVERRERAEQDIERAGADAIARIYEEAADLSTSIASKILQRNLNVDDQRELVNRSLDQLRTVAAK